MSQVQVLPDILINQIAAGEVIERPASVVKELVENALDAGAARVTVEIEGGGVARISVTDDGSGMSPEDARMALERHATSKIRTLGDLDGILTLGFRGEALPSIASVSRFTLTTSTDDSGLGAELIVDQGASPRAGAARQPKGTRVLVQDLFGNVPARRKFLKSAEAEMRAVVRTVTALALARPDVAFTLRSGVRTLLELPVAPDSATRFVETVGRSALGGVVAISSEAFGLRLTGAISRPDITFASRTYQWFYVNGRAARDSSVSHAALLATREALRSDRFPAFVLFLSCDPSACDVNVHPQKHEVRFRDPSALHSLVHRALVAALGGAKTADALSGDRLTQPASAGWTFARPPGASPAAAAMAEAIGLYDVRAGSPRQESLLQALPASLVRSRYGEGAAAPSPIGPLRLLGQYRDSFLIAEGENGLVLIDQHVAHERVRYERILARLEESENGSSQSLLLPVTFEATPDEAATLVSSEQLLARAGFTLSELSGRVFLISAAPTGTAAAAIVPFLRDLLARIPEGLDAGTERSEEKRAKEILAASLACRGAITINTRISAEEATRLLTDLSACRDPFTCPHGRPILLNLEHVELERRFGRRG